jgi:hypothetical protein
MKRMEGRTVVAEPAEMVGRWKERKKEFNFSRDMCELSCDGTIGDGYNSMNFLLRLLPN